MLSKRHAFIAGAGLCATLVLGLAPALAQDDLRDLIGIWVSKVQGGGVTIVQRFQVTTGPGTVTMRWTGGDMSPRPAGFRGVESQAKLYRFSVSGRDLSGTVVVSNTGVNCRTPENTFSTSGRLSPDGQTITIIDEHPQITMVPCGWSQPTEVVSVFTRDR